MPRIEGARRGVQVVLQRDKHPEVPNVAEERNRKSPTGPLVEKAGSGGREGELQAYRTIPLVSPLIRE